MTDWLQFLFGVVIGVGLSVGLISLITLIRDRRNTKFAKNYPDKNPLVPLPDRFWLAADADGYIRPWAGHPGRFVVVLNEPWFWYDNPDDALRRSNYHGLNDGHYMAFGPYEVLNPKTAQLGTLLNVCKLQ